MPELKQLNAQVIFARLRILLNEPVVLQRHQNPMGGAFVQAGRSAYLANAQLRFVKTKTVEDARGSVDHLNSVKVRVAV